jgi:hypothetical protein
MSVLTEGGNVTPFTPFSPASPDSATPAEAGDHERWIGETGPLASPFERGFSRELGRDESELLADTAAELLTELEDEDFADALQALVDEAASRHAADLVSWSAVPTPEQARSLLEGWIEPVATEAEHGVDAVAQRLGGADVATLSEAELDHLLDGLEVRAPDGNEVFEQFLGRWVSKITDVAKKAVKSAVNVVGKILPIGAILDKIKGFVRPMLRGVLDAGIARLPQAVQPIARTLAAKLGVREAEALEPSEAEDDGARLAEQFDQGVAMLLLGPDQEAFLGESADAVPFGREDEGGARDAVAELDRARAKLAEQLVELPADANPSREIEQFLPAIMAVQPFVKMGIGLIGRGRVVGFIADRIAGLIKGVIGADAARQLSRPLVDVGLRALGLEAPAAPELVAGEALASTVEGTMERLLDLPAEAFDDPLRLDAAVQSAFAEAAAAYLPGRFLAPDLPERETADREAAWLLVPPAARPAYRCRRYTRRFAIPIRRQVARAIRWSDGGTLESYLLDQGARNWPVQAEVELYEALPGSRTGHFVPHRDGDASAAEAAAEFQPLTPEVAGLLVGEPGLGRRVPPLRSGRPRRYFRVRVVGLPGGLPGVPGGRVRRPRRRVLVRFDLAAASPSVTIVLRLAEGQAQQLLTKLEPGQGGKADLGGALAALQAHYAAALPAAVVGRLLRSGLVPGAADAGRVAEQATSAVTAALSAFLTERAQQLVGAARSRAEGVTITVTFPGVTRQLLTQKDAQAWPAGRVTVTEGWRRG